MVDTYGPRKVIAPFAALAVIALGLLSLCKEYWQIMLCQGLAFGLACSGTTLPAVVTVSQWFSTRRGLAVGVASCGSSFGGVIFPIMVSKLIQSHGFPTAARWSALVVGCSMFIGVLCCANPFPAMAEVEKTRNLTMRERESSNGSNTDLESHLKDSVRTQSEGQEKELADLSCLEMV